MELYIINVEQLERYKIRKEELERVFNFLTFDDLKIELENRGYENITEEILTMYCNKVLTKYDGSHMDDIIEFLEYKGCLK